MAVYNCKMCGGSLDIAEGLTIAECEYCGAKQTVPKAVDENLQNIFNRANTLRIKSEFDKAEKLYEKIVQMDSTQSEAYWGLILCKYGIEYVDDPQTLKKIPTCHRASYDSIIADEDYKSALEHADMSQRALYEEQAKEIDRIQKEILALAQNEESYDVFICYKETDANGQRTQDSVIANDIYYQLTNEGFKVFYAAITLEGKLGSAYEPIIFAALNSAKVMLSIGTKPEYFNAVWVKNEWSRFLKIIQKDRSKLLIPCYRDMDAYELPEEFAHLQAQDMAKIGFINDLVRGIQKVLVTKEEAQPTVVRETVVTGGNANANTLLERMFMFLEDRDWNSAEEYGEKVLDIDPKCAEAYLGKLMAELRVEKKEELKDCKEPFDEYNNYQKVLRFGDEKLKAELIACIEHINTRNENARLENIYTRGQNAMSAAETEADFKKAAELFNSIPDYMDATNLAKECLEKAEAARKDAILADGKSRMTGEEVSAYEATIPLFQSISGWKDADEQIIACQKKIEEIKAKEEAERLKRERQAEIARKEAERIAKRNKKIVIITTPIVCAIIAFIIVLNAVIIPNNKYNSAMALIDAGDYEAAYALLEEIGNSYAIASNKYDRAMALIDAGNYEAAYALLEEVGNSYAIASSKYDRAMALIDSGDYEAAYILLNGLDYKDSASLRETIQASDAWLKICPIGETFFFGAYEQDYNTTNGQEEIEWIVLAREGERVLVISRYALDCKEYNGDTWETSSLRKWLNGTFLNGAFSESERAMIPSVTVRADKNPRYSTSPGNNTTDQVFLLSVTEANKYFSSDSARQCKPTAYVVAKQARVIDGNCYWWLRSPGEDSHYVAVVPNDGNVYYKGFGTSSTDEAVRPALWIDLNA